MRSTKTAFAAWLQTALIVLLLLSFVMIAQQSNRNVYEKGMMLLIGATLIQIPFGNVPATANFRQSIFYLAIGLAIVAAICILSIRITPYLLTLGRG